VHSGWIVFHGGISGSIPLLIATDGHFSQSVIGIVPTSQTIFSSFNILIVASLFVAVPLMNWLMVGRHGDTVCVDRSKLAEEDRPQPEYRGDTLAERLDNSLLISLGIGLLALTYIVVHFFVKKGDLNINMLNLVFLTAGIMLHGSPRRFLASLQEAVKGVSAIIIARPEGRNQRRLSRGGPDLTWRARISNLTIG
jgi:short-chain fatty acids transporter